MTDPAFIFVVIVVAGLVAALALLFTIALGFLKLRLHLLVCLAFMKAVGVRFMDGAAPFLATIIAIGGG